MASSSALGGMGKEAMGEAHKCSVSHECEIVSFLSLWRHVEVLELIASGGVRVWVVETRFTSHTLVLRRLVKVKHALSDMVIDNVWTIWRQSNTERAYKIKTLILDDLWAQVEYLRSFTKHVLCMIRFVDKDSVCIREIYDGIDFMLEKMKEIIQAKEKDPKENFYNEVKSVVMKSFMDSYVYYKEAEKLVVHLQEVPESVVNISHRSRSAESIEAQERAKARTSLLLEKAAEKARQVKIFDMIAEKVKGPLVFLSSCYKEKGRVQVWTRHTHGIRGNLIGFLHAFDRHMNMILQDVEEVYTVRRHVPRLVNKRGCRSKILKDDSNNECSSSVAENSDLSTVNMQAIENSDLSTVNAQAIENSSKKIDEITEGLKELRLFPKLEHRRRHVGQVFLRGDSVVMVR
ncbi:hypothetical protein KI387_005552, partial [Taxus chinensis]